MVRAIKEKVTVEKEGTLEIRHPDLKAGSDAEVIILIDVPARREEPAPAANAPIWEIAAEIAGTVPDGEWQRLPADLSKNLDHYLYGAPKEEG